MKNNEIRLFDLECIGEYLFVYSDNYNIFIFFLDYEDNVLHKITTDKFYNINYVDEIKTPDNFAKYNSIKFFKPTLQNNSDYVFTGLVSYNDNRDVYKFKIDLNNNLEYIKETNSIGNEGIIKSLSCLSEIDIYSYIQKKNKIYITGYDNKYNDYIYAIVNIEDDKIDKIYALYSDYGDIIPTAINIDVSDNRIYVVGKIMQYDNNDKVISVKPYFESFCFL